MLHDPELGQFPYRPALSEAIAIIYASKNGLVLSTPPTSGFIRRTEPGSRYNYRRPQWNKFTRMEFGRARQRSRSADVSRGLATIRERSRSRDRDQR